MCVYRIGTFSELRQRITHQRFNSRVFLSALEVPVIYK